MPIVSNNPVIDTSAKTRRTVCEPFQAANNNRIKGMKCAIILVEKSFFCAVCKIIESRWAAISVFLLHLQH